MKTPKLIWLIIAFGASLIITLFIVRGPGITHDSVNYMSAAKSLVEGKGLHMNNGSAFTSWPPLYPVLLSPAAWNDQVLLIWGAVLNLACYVLLAIIIWRIMDVESTFSRKTKVISFTAIILSTPFLLNFSFIWTEPIFTLFVCAALLRTIRPDLVSNKIRYLTSFALPLTRFIGLPLAVWFTWREKNVIKKWVLLGFAIVPCLGFIGYNHFTHGAAVGPRNFGGGSIADIIFQYLNTVGMQFTPDLFPSWRAITGTAVTCIVAFYSLKTRSKIGQLFLVYSASLIALAWFAQIEDLDDRLLFPCLPFLLILLFRSISEFVKQKGVKSIIEYSLMAVLACRSVYFLYSQLTLQP